MPTLSRLLLPHSCRHSWPLRLALLLAIAGASHGAARAQARPGPASVFRPGDRIYLRVEGEQQLTDTFTVRVGPAIELPVLGAISLAGVRRGDVGPYLKREISRFVKQPVITVRPLVRVGVIGEVAHPGFHELPSDALLSDAFNAAGGLTKDAGMTRLRLERNGAPVVRDRDLRRALDQGVTLEEIGFQSGDELIVPTRGDTERSLRMIAIVASIPTAIVAVLLLHK